MSASDAEFIWAAILAGIVVLFGLSLFGLLSAVRDAARLLRRWRAMR